MKPVSGPNSQKIIHRYDKIDADLWKSEAKVFEMFVDKRQKVLILGSGGGRAANDRVNNTDHKQFWREEKQRWRTGTQDKRLEVLMFYVARKK